jgi:menin
MKEYFPLKTCKDVVAAVTSEVSVSDRQPNLTVLSVVLGLVEAQLTSLSFLVPSDSDASDPCLLLLNNSTTTGGNNNNDLSSSNNNDNTEDFNLPQVIPWSRVKDLVDKFRSLIKGSLDLSLLLDVKKQEIVGRVSDVIWSFLSPSVNGHSVSDSHHEASSSSSSHVQFLTSFILEKRLDSFGLTFAVMAGLQVLFPKTWFKDYFLTLSEDHSWISVVNEDVESVHGPLSRVEVTWHSKSDKRVLNCRSMEGGEGGVTAPFGDNWLYLRGHAVVCREVSLLVSALVSSINPSIGSSGDSLPLAVVQRRILSDFHSKGFLSKYPMSLGNLADLMELTTSQVGNHAVITSLYYEAVASSMTYYDSHHIYPYLYLAGYCFRSSRYSESLFHWKEASKVLSKYNYNPKEDEEAYKELQEISSDLIPYALNRISVSGTLTPDNYRDVIEFYDGLCSWEESSRWPVLHITWSKHFVSSLNKFPPSIRSRVKVSVTSTARVNDMTIDDRTAASPVDEEGQESIKTTDTGEEVSSKTSQEIRDIVKQCSRDPHFLLSTHHGQDGDDDQVAQTTTTEIRVSSKKMSELRDLLVKAEGKLNSSAIQLQLTAQSSLITFSKSCALKRQRNPTQHHLSIRVASPSSSTSSISPNDSFRSRADSSSGKRLRTSNSKYLQ